MRVCKSTGLQMTRLKTSNGAKSKIRIGLPNGKSIGDRRKPPNLSSPQPGRKSKTLKKSLLAVELRIGFRDGNTRNDAALSESNRRIWPEETFFDVGTGTGILAIAAAKFQVPSFKFQVAGCDTDEDAIKIAKENAELNKTESIEFYAG